MTPQGAEGGPLSPDADHYHRGPAGELVEYAPRSCPQGHDLTGPETMLVANIPCMCAAPLIGVRAHRSWRCRRCDREWVWPACQLRPTLPAWDGHHPLPRGRHPSRAATHSPRPTPDRSMQSDLPAERSCHAR